MVSMNPEPAGGELTACYIPEVFQLHFNCLTKIRDACQLCCYVINTAV